MNSIGEKIIDAIIRGGLCHAECAAEKDHPCVVVWSSGAADQIDAIISESRGGSNGTEATR